MARQKIPYTGGMVPAGYKLKKRGYLKPKRKYLKRTANATGNPLGIVPGYGPRPAMALLPLLGIGALGLLAWKLFSKKKCCYVNAPSSIIY